MTLAPVLGFADFNFTLFCEPKRENAAFALPPKKAKDPEKAAFDSLLLGASRSLGSTFSKSCHVQAYRPLRRLS